MRLFVALDLPPEARAAMPAPPPPFRAVPSESLHVTLAFLGWRTGDAADRAAAVLDPPRAGPLVPAEIVALPPRRPRVLAVRLEDPTGDCRRCQAAVAQALARAGLYDPEPRPWLPHVTIGRAREPVPRGTSAPPPAPVPFHAPSVTLYRSLGSPAGVRYEALRTWGV